MSRVIPKKRYGQHFLRDANIIRRIVGGSGITGSDIILEVGPGLGDMTSQIRGSAGHVVAVEIDRELFAILDERFREDDKVEVINQDALAFDISGISMRYGGKIKVVANLPYNISSPLLFRFFDERKHIDSMTLMFQKEVADRIVAVPGTKDYGVLSVYSQLFTQPKRLFNVAPGAFDPPPKVDSAVVYFRMLDTPSVKPDNEELMLRVVKAAFGQRRKTLRNSLKSGLGVPSDLVEKALESSNIDGTRRGETLSLEEFCRLSNLFNIITN